MPKNLTIIVYKPDSQSTDEFMVYVDPLQYHKWKEGDVVDSFDVFHTGQGVQGLQGRASKQQLDTIFGTHKDFDVVEQILKNGKLQHGDLHSNIQLMEKGQMPSRNLARGNTSNLR